MSIRRDSPAKFLGALLLACLALPAGASLGTVEQAFELLPSQVQLPDRSPAGLTVRPCPTCPPVILQVTADTAWFARPGLRQPAEQAAVLEAFRAAANSKTTLVYVYYEPRTRRVNRVVLDVRASAAER